MVINMERRRFIKTSLTAGFAVAINPLSAASVLADNNKEAILMDNVKCVNCQRCVKACSDLYEVDPNHPYLIVEQHKKDGMLYKKRISCMHCHDAPCVKACPTRTLYKGDNGFTYVNRNTCIGCGYCMKVCPYNIISLYNNRVNKCVGCRELTSRGMLPRCVSACPVRALQFGAREKIIAAGAASTDSLTTKYPRANLYGGSTLGGLGVLLILGDNPEAYGYPEEPTLNLLLRGWKDYLHTGGLFVTAAVAAIGIATFGIARKNYKNEKFSGDGGAKDE